MPCAFCGRWAYCFQWYRCDVFDDDWKVIYTTATVNQAGYRGVEWHSDGHLTQAGAFIDAMPRLVALFMLSSFTADNGGTWILPASHHADTAPELSWSEAEQASPQEAAVHITGPAGSVFFFDCRTFHSAAPNFTDSPRIAMTVRYSPSWLATEAGAGRTSGQPGPWEPLPEDFFAGLSPEAQKRFVHAHRWDINDHLPLAPFPFGNRDKEQLLVRQRG